MEVLTKFTNAIEKFYCENDMKILGGVKYTSMVVAPILAAAAAVRTVKTIESLEREHGPIKPKEKIKIILKNSVLPIGVTAAGIYSSAKIDSKNEKTIEALTTGAVLMEREYRELKESQTEVVGKEKSAEIEKKKNEKAFETIDTSQVKTDPLNGVYACREPKLGQIWATTQNKLTAAITNVYRRTAAGNDVSLEDFITDAGGDPSEFGELYGFKGKLGVEYNITWSYADDRNGNPGFIIVYGYGSQPCLLNE